MPRVETLTRLTFEVYCLPSDKDAVLESFEDWFYENDAPLAQEKEVVATEVPASAVSDNTSQFFNEDALFDAGPDEGKA